MAHKGLDEMLVKLAAMVGDLVLRARFLSLVAELTDEDEKAHYILALARLIKSTEPAESIRLAHFVIGYDSGRVTALHHIAECFRQMGRFGKAEVIENQVARLKDESGQQSSPDEASIALIRATIAEAVAVSDPVLSTQHADHATDNQTRIRPAAARERQPKESVLDSETASALRPNVDVSPAQGVALAETWLDRVDQLIDMGEPRRALRQIVQGANLSWSVRDCEQAYPRLQTAWRLLGLVGFSWKAADGKDAFLAKLSERPEQTMVNLGTSLHANLPKGAKS